MDEALKKQIKEALAIGESVANICSLARIIGIDENDPTLIEVLQETIEEPYVIICEDTSGHRVFGAGRASTLDLAIKRAEEFTQTSRSFNEIPDMEPNIYRYRVYGPGNNDGIDVK